MSTAYKTSEVETGFKNTDSSHSLNVAWLGRVDYQRALELQEALAAARLREDSVDSLLLLEHPHVYTLGRGADERFVLDPAGIPVYRVSRGGQVTYHGPGQLIGYPIVKLEGVERDVIRYLRRLEQVLIESLATLGIAAQRRAPSNRRLGWTRKDRLDRGRLQTMGFAAWVRPQCHDGFEFF